MNNQESYVQRRMLFKDIWETAMNIDDKTDIMNKPKVIKTLRLDEVDKCVVGKTKKQRIKNLRHVCNRILDFCDRQDADDVLYEQLVSADQEQTLAHHKVDANPPRKKTYRVKRKLKKTKSLYGTTKNPTVMKATVSERKGAKNKSPRVASPRVASPKVASPNKRKKSPVRTKTKVRLKSKQSPEKLLEALEDTSSSSNAESVASAVRRKPVKMKPGKRKKTHSNVKAIGHMNMKIGNLARRTSPITTKTDFPKPIQVTKIMVN